MQRLERALQDRRPQIDLYERYYDGDHDLLFATSKYREAFGNLFAPFRSNWCEVVVDTAAELLRVDGFRFGNDVEADDDAAAIWQENGMDAESAIAFEDAIKLTTVYAMVEPNGSSAPQISIEHPAECIVEHAPGRRRQRVAALKMWRDDVAGKAYANVYGPEWVWKFWRTEVVMPEAMNRFWMPASAHIGPGAWDLLEAPSRNPLGVVSLVPIVNRRRLRGVVRAGRSELDAVIPLNNFVNKIFGDAVIGSEYAAYPQRWATGIEPDTDEEGNELAVQKANEYVASMSRLWENASDKAKYGAFPTADTDNWVKLVNLGVQHVAALSRTPFQYFIADMVNISGDAAKEGKAGLIAKTYRKQTFFGEDLEELMRVAFLAAGDRRRATQTRAETIWADCETRTEGERVDALTKLSSLKVPRRALWERIPGVTQEQLKRWERMAADEDRAALQAGLFGGLDLTAPNGGGGEDPEPAAAGADAGD